MIQPSGLSIGERRFHIRNRRIVSAAPKEAPVRPLYACRDRSMEVASYNNLCYSS